MWWKAAVIGLELLDAVASIEDVADEAGPILDSIWSGVSSLFADDSTPVTQDPSKVIPILENAKKEAQKGAQIQGATSPLFADMAVAFGKALLELSGLSGSSSSSGVVTDDMFSTTGTLETGTPSLGGDLTDPEPTGNGRPAGGYTFTDVDRADFRNVYYGSNAKRAGVAEMIKSFARLARLSEDAIDALDADLGNAL